MRNPLIPIIPIVLSIATYFAFAAPWWDEVGILKNNIQVAKEAIVQGNELKELVQNITEKVNMVPAEDRSRLRAVLPLQIDDILFLNDLNALAGNRGLQAKNLTLSEDASPASDTPATAESSGATKGASPQKTKTAGFSVTAKYPAFILFLRDLEQSLVLYEIRSIAFSEAGAKNTDSASVKSAGAKSGQPLVPSGDDYAVKFSTYSVE